MFDMVRKIGQSIFNKLLLYFIGVNLLLICIMGYSHYLHTMDTLKDSVKEQIESSMAISLEYFNRVYREARIKDLRLVMSSPSLYGLLMSSKEEVYLYKPDVEGLLLNVSEMSKNLYISLRFIDKDGLEKVVVEGDKRIKKYENIYNPVGGNKALYKDMLALYKNLKKDNSYNRIMFNGPLSGAQERTFLIGIAKGDPDVGSFAGAFIFHVRLDDFFSYLTKLKIFDRNVTWVLDNNGRLLLSPPVSERFLDPRPFLKDEIQVPEGSFIFTSICSINNYDSFLLKVVYSVPEGVFPDKLKGHLVDTYVILFFTLAISVLVTYIISRYLLKPVSDLVKASVAISKGEFNVKVEARRKDEIGQLSHSFNEMSFQLDLYKKQLEYNYYSQNALNTILELSLKPEPLYDLLYKILDEIISLPWLKLMSKGAIFLVEKEPGVLTLCAQKGFSERQAEICQNVPFGKCICGMSAKKGELLFVGDSASGHEMEIDKHFPHGHYCIPIILDFKVIGVINLYVKEGQRQDARDEEFLISVSNTLAGIIQRKRAKEHLEMFKMMIEAANDVVFFKDLESRYVTANSRTLSFFGLTHDEVIGKDDVEIMMDKEEAKRNLLDDQSVFNTGRAKEIVKVMTAPDGQRYWFQAVKVPYFENGTEIKGLVGIARDITKLKRVEEALRENEQRFRKIFEEGPLGMCLTDGNYRFITVNEMLCQITGYSEKELLNLTFLDITHPDDLKAEMEKAGELDNNKISKIKMEKRYIRKDETIIWVNLTATIIFDENGAFMYYLAMMEDVTEQKKLHKKLETLAHYDSLSGLPNRILFFERLNQAYLISKRNSLKFALMFLDLDRFKYVNDTYGHDVGDMLIQEVSKRLEGLLRQSDTVARMGGDEFVVILNDVEENVDAAIVAQKIVEQIVEPFNLKDNECFIGVSIGISLYPDNGENVDMLLKNADTAMYHAKQINGSNYKFYSKDMEVAADRRMEIEGKLHYALDNDEFELFYQPIFGLERKEIVCLEALLRWKLGGRLVEPSEFLHIANESGRMFEIGEWVLRTACVDLKRLHLKGYGKLCVSINVPMMQFMKQPNIVDTVSLVLTEMGIEPSYLNFELTETICVNTLKEVVSVIDQLTSLGVKFSIDDFGSGYAVLSCLKYLSIDKLKIDQTFIHNVEVDINNAGIVRAIIAMAHSMNLQVVAEGVETHGQAIFLTSIGCNEAQGFYYCEPVIISELEERIALRDGRCFLAKSS